MKTAIFGGHDEVRAAPGAPSLSFTPPHALSLGGANRAGGAALHKRSNAQPQAGKPSATGSAGISAGGSASPLGPAPPSHHSLSVHPAGFRPHTRRTSRMTNVSARSDAGAKRE